MKGGREDGPAPEIERSDEIFYLTRLHTLIGQLQAPLETASLLTARMSWICSLAIVAALCERCFTCESYGSVSVIGVDIVVGEEGGYTGFRARHRGFKTGAARAKSS